MSDLRVSNLRGRTVGSSPSLPDGLNVTGGISTTGKLVVNNSTQSTSTTTGALVIGGGVGIAKSLHVGGNVSVGGTLTYEDVTNIDSVGIITARDDINIVTDNKKLNIGAGADLSLYHSGTHSFIEDSGTGSLKIRGSVVELSGTNAAQMMLATENGSINLYYNGSKKFETTSGGVKVTGQETSIVTAVSGTAIDCSLGNYFTKTITGSTTFTFTNIPASGTEYSMTVELDLNGSNAVVWPASVTWPADTAPTITDAKTQLFMFVTVDGGTKWRGGTLVDYTT